MIANQRSRLFQWTVSRLPIFGLWSVIGLTFALSMYYQDLAQRTPLPWKRALGYNFLYYYIWMGLSIPIAALGKRFPLKRNHWVKSIAFHFPMGALFGALHMLIFMPILFKFTSERSGIGTLEAVKEALKFAYASRLQYGMIAYWSILAVTSAIKERSNAARLETQLAQAQLQALRMQLHPHFLFNTLHSISALVLDDGPQAKRMISNLGDFLRMTLDSSGAQQVPFSVELEFLRRYLAIEQVRFQDRLSVQIDVDPETLTASVPNLILQPIVENAIRHGIAPRIAPGHIEIQARKLNGSLNIQIQDDGVGPPEDSDAPPKQGVGLSNVRARLEQLYAENYRFDFSGLDTGGVRVTIEIPFTIDASAQITIKGNGKSA